MNGFSIHYELREEGPPLLLRHGGTGCHADWGNACREFFGREYRLFGPDGHGRSTNNKPTITHRQCALDTLTLLDHLKIGRCRAIGVSMGGNVLLHMATISRSASRQW